MGGWDVLEDAAGGIQGHVNALVMASLREVKRANDIGAEGLVLVGFAPVDVGAAGDACVGGWVD